MDGFGATMPVRNPDMTMITHAPARHETVEDADPGGPAGSDVSAKPWLTLVHGAAQDRRVFSAQVAAFRASHRLLLIDLPGHGSSASLPGPYGLQEYAGSVLAAMRAAGVERTHFWGTHTGAGVALLLACREPARFASLVLEGPVFPHRLPPSALEMLTQARELARDQGMEAARQHWWERSPWFEVMRKQPAACRAQEQLAMLEEFPGAPWLDTGTPAPVDFSDDALRQLQVPVMIVNGEHEVPDFLRAADEMMELLPNAERVVIPGGGGFPLWEFPQRVNAEVGRFLE